MNEATGEDRTDRVGHAPVLVFGDDGSPSAGHRVAVDQQPTLAPLGGPGRHRRLTTSPGVVVGCASTRGALDASMGEAVLDVDKLDSIEFLRVGADPRLVLDEQRDVDIVVVGRRGLGAIRAFWDVSTTDWLVQYASHPSRAARSASVVRRVTCCVDGSAHAEAAVAATVRLPLLATAEITLLAVDDGMVDTEDSAPPHVGAGREPRVHCPMPTGHRTRGAASPRTSHRGHPRPHRPRNPRVDGVGSHDARVDRRRVVQHPSSNCLLASAP